MRTIRGAVDIWVLAIVVLLGAIVALGLWTWGLYQGVRELESAGMEQSIKDLKLVQKMAVQIAALHQNARTLARDEDTSSLLTFFDQQARAAGVDGTKIKGMQPLPKLPPRNGYTEVGFKIHFQQVSRDQLARFLFNIEDQKPFVKSKAIDMKLDEYHNVVEAFVTLCYYVR